jgi:hypothetical protein
MKLSKSWKIKQILFNIIKIIHYTFKSLRQIPFKSSLKSLKDEITCWKFCIAFFLNACCCLKLTVVISLDARRKMNFIIWHMTFIFVLLVEALVSNISVTTSFFSKPKLVVKFFFFLSSGYWCFNNIILWIYKCVPFICKAQPT